MHDDSPTEPPEATEELGTYELRVQGQLGPLMLSALPHAAATRLPAHTLLVTEELDERDLVEIVRLIVEKGYVVESVRTATRRTG
jgi:hypothetical protein